MQFFMLFYIIISMYIKNLRVRQLKSSLNLSTTNKKLLNLYCLKNVLAKEFPLHLPMQASLINLCTDLFQYVMEKADQCLLN